MPSERKTEMIRIPCTKKTKRAWEQWYYRKKSEGEVKTLEDALLFLLEKELGIILRRRYIMPSRV